MAILYLLRKDLRTEDNLIFEYIASKKEACILLFVSDPRDPTADSISCHYRNYYLNLLNNDCHDTLHYESGLTEKILSAYVDSYPIDEVVYQRQYEPWEIEIEKHLRQMKVTSRVFEDYLLSSPENCLNGAGELYKVFSPFYRNWLKTLNPIKIIEYDLRDISFMAVNDHRLPQLPKRHPEEVNHSFFEDRIQDYDRYKDYPSMPYTSRVSMLLNLGVCSVRSIYLSGIKSPDYIRQLAWREYYNHWFYYNPSVINHNYRNLELEWSTDDKRLEAWKNGRTGYDLVDAAMRQLNSEGWIHGRLRMVAASFLVKDLQMDWRLGEAYFFEKLIDADKALNVGNWQWIAGTGAVIQPYFRILSPERQLERFDKERRYVSKYVDGHSPHIVDHAVEKENFIAAYKKALSR